MKAIIERYRHILIWSATLLLLFLILSLSGGSAEFLWPKAPGWSRARLVGRTNTKQIAPLALDDSGHIYLLTFAANAQNTHPQVIALDRFAERVWEVTLDRPAADPEQPQIHWNGEALYLFWLEAGQIYTAQLDATGSVRQSPTVLSGSSTVETYDTAVSNEGAIQVWYSGSRRESGIYAVSPDDPNREAILIDAAGVQPRLAFDSSAGLHATWLTYPSGNSPTIQYAVYQNSAVSSGQGTPVLDLELRTNSDLEGYWFGLDDQKVYLIWRTIIDTGFQRVQQVEYTHFPINNPTELADKSFITVPYSRDVTYSADVEGTLAAGPRASLLSPRPGRNIAPGELLVNSGQVQELALAARVQISYLRNRRASQIATIFFQGGQLTSYQLLNFTQSPSGAPVLVSDDSQQLYLTWLEADGRVDSNIYFTSTAPDIRLEFSALTRNDVIQITSNTIFGLLQGAVLGPFAAIIWSIVPILILGLTWILRRDKKSLTNYGALTSLTLAMAAYWTGKLFMLAAARTHVPFSGWIPILPSWLDIPLQVGVPVITTLIALWVAWHYTQRWAADSTALFVGIYAVSDSLLTMAIYGGLLYDAF